MNVASKIASWLVEKEISHVFGIIGSGNMAIFDAISKKKEITLVCVHHEAAAATASDFFNRTTGGLKSACLVTAGAGSSNAITGALAAFMDSSPLLVISGQEATPFFDVPHPRVLGVQGYSSIEVAKPITKYQERLMIVNFGGFVEATLDRCYRKATTGRMGPVWLDIPRNIQTQELP